MTRPKVSIVITTYNRLPQLRQTLPTILNQTYSQSEFILCDDASSDGTEEWVRSLLKEEARLHYVRNVSTVGIYDNYQIGLSHCNGDYVAIFHDHDLYHPRIVEKCCRVLDDYPAVSFVHTGLLWIDSSGGPTRIDLRKFSEVTAGADFRDLMTTLTASPVMAATVVVRRSAYRTVGPYRPLAYGMGCDAMMWFQLANVGDVGYVSEPLALIREREKNKGVGVFSWTEEQKAAQMWRDIRNSLFPKHLARYIARKAALRVYHEHRWAQRIARALVLDHDAVQRGLTFCTNERALVGLLTYGLIRHAPGGLHCANKTLLAWHYSGTRRQVKAEAAKVRQFLADTPTVGRWVAESAGGPASTSCIDNGPQPPARHG